MKSVLQVLLMAALLGLGWWAGDRWSLAIRPASHTLASEPASSLRLMSMVSASLPRLDALETADVIHSRQSDAATIELPAGVRQCGFPRVYMRESDVQTGWGEPRESGKFDFNIGYQF